MKIFIKNNKVRLIITIILLIWVSLCAIEYKANKIEQQKNYDEIFCTLQSEEESIMISPWPEWKEEWNFAADEQAVETIKEAVRSIRGVRTEMNVPPSKKATVYVVSDEADVRGTKEPT